jgi:hypothetical protein
MSGADSGQVVCRLCVSPIVSWRQMVGEVESEDSSHSIDDRDGRMLVGLVWP